MAEGFNKTDDFKFDIKKSFGILSESAKGWKTELNLVSWSGREEKYDIRAWDSEHKKMSKGITLSKEELLALKDILNQHF